MTTAIVIQKPDAIVSRVDKARMLAAQVWDATDAKRVADFARAPGIL